MHAVQHSRSGMRSTGIALREARRVVDGLWEFDALGEGGGCEVSRSEVEHETECECRRQGWRGAVRSALCSLRCLRLMLGTLTVMTAGGVSSSARCLRQEGRTRERFSRWRRDCSSTSGMTTHVVSKCTRCDGLGGSNIGILELAVAVVVAVRVGGIVG